MSRVSLQWISTSLAQAPPWPSWYVRANKTFGCRSWPAASGTLDSTPSQLPRRIGIDSTAARTEAWNSLVSSWSAMDWNWKTRPLTRPRASTGGTSWERLRGTELLVREVEAGHGDQSPAEEAHDAQEHEERHREHDPAADVVELLGDLVAGVAKEPDGRDEADDVADDGGEGARGQDEQPDAVTQRHGVRESVGDEDQGEDHPHSVARLGDGHVVAVDREHVGAALDGDAHGFEEGLGDDGCRGLERYGDGLADRAGHGNEEGEHHEGGQEPEENVLPEHGKDTAGDHRDRTGVPDGLQRMVVAVDRRGPAEGDDERADHHAGRHAETEAGATGPDHPRRDERDEVDVARPFVLRGDEGDVGPGAARGPEAKSPHGDGAEKVPDRPTVGGEAADIHARPPPLRPGRSTIWSATVRPALTTPPGHTTQRTAAALRWSVAPDS